MPKGKTKFQTNWLNKELDGVQIKEWCSEAKDDKYQARCALCTEVFDVSNSGFSQVKSHHKGKKHGQKFKKRFKNNYSIADAFRKHDEDPTASRKIDELSHDFRVAKAEAIWAMRVAENNMSFKSCTESVDLFKIMFPDSITARDMQLAEKKVAYVISHGLAKHFDESLKNDLAACKTKVAIAFDETTNVQVKKTNGCPH